MRKIQLRDPTNNQFAFQNNWKRLCVCGHNLGVHTAGGFDCLNEDNHCSPDATGDACNCHKFRPKKKTNYLDALGGLDGPEVGKILQATAIAKCDGDSDEN